jgi:hypothetical protein
MVICAKVCAKASGAAPRLFRSLTTAEWDSLEKAEAFFKSKAWADLAPDRDKALKTVRRYAVEVAKSRALSDL